MEVSAEIEKLGARVISYVFDGIYILARDEQHLREVYRGAAAALLHGAR